MTQLDEKTREAIIQKNVEERKAKDIDSLLAGLDGLFNEKDGVKPVMGLKESSPKILFLLKSLKDIFAALEKEKTNLESFYSKYPSYKKGTEGFYIFLNHIEDRIKSRQPENQTTQIHLNDDYYLLFWADYWNVKNNSKEFK